MSGTFVSGFVCCYAAALVFELLRFKSYRVSITLSVLCTVAGLFVHISYLWAYHFRQTPAAMFMFAAAWGIAVVYSALACFHTKTPSGFVLLPLVLLFTGCGWLLTGSTVAGSFVSNSLFFIHLHIATLLTATVCVCLSFFAAVMYLLQDIRLRRKQLPGENLKLPTLEWSLAVCRWSLVLSVVLFLGGIFSGIHLATVQKLNLPAGFAQDPLMFGAVILSSVLFLYFILFPKSNGRLVSLSAVFVFFCLIAVLMSALFVSVAHWKTPFNF